MKNHLERGTLRWGFPKKALKMRLTTLLLVISFFQVQANTYAQKTRLSLDLKDTSVGQVFEKIEEISEFRFLFESGQIDLARKVSLKVSNKKISEVLPLLFEGSDINYRIRGRQVILTRAVSDFKSPGSSTPDTVTDENEIPQEEISGTVTDAEGVPLAGANVVEKGTTNGTQTDFDGNFSITVGEDAVLVFSYIGFAAQEIEVEGQEVITVSLVEDAAGLEEVVVVGYGTQKKSDLVGSVASVSSERLEQNANPNLFQAIQASVPGLNISRGSGDPGTSGSIQIRGLNSISANNSPLIVVDGIPFSGNIRDINPNDISSVEVLKDASASAIYGSRAASGVILINTKTGTTGKTIIEFNTSVAIQGEAVEYEVMNAEEFFQFRREAHRTEGTITGNETDDQAAPLILEQNELKSYQRGESVDWIDVMLNAAPIRQSNQISVNTGSEKLKNYFSLSYVDEDGLQKKTGFKRATLKNNFEISSIAPWLKIGDNLLFSYNNFNRMVWGINNQPAFYRLSPYARIFEDDGSYTRFPQANDELLVNPVAENELSTRANDFTNFFNNIYFEITPGFAEGLSYRLNFGTTLRNTKEAIYWPRGTWLGDTNGGLAEVEVSRLWEYTLENILKFTRSFGDHNLDLTGLFSRQSHDFERTTSGASGFVTDDLLWYDLNAGETPILPGSGFNPKNEWDLVSYMARLNYNYKSRYYLTATIRRDGYSGFALNNKYGNFPSAALAWRVSGEPFMEKAAWIDDLKFRVSYGTVGNQAVGTYRSLASLRNAQYVFGETVTGGVKVNSLRNDNLGWEQATTLNIGTDFSFAKNRVSGSVDFYSTETEDLLLNREIPKITGQNNILFNIGKLKNVGYEVALNTIPVSTDNFTWRLGLNFSTNKNEIVDLYGNQEDDIQNQWFIGEPLNVIYDFVFDGIWQLGEEDEIAASATPDRQPGDVKIRDLNDDGVIDADDRAIVGVQQPDWLGGLNSTFRYKDLSLDVFVQTVQGIDRRFREEGTSARFIKAPYDYWTPENPSNTWFRPRINAGPTPLGSIGVYDASFVRIKDITLAYNLPTSLTDKTGLDRAKIYVNLHDYFTFTDFPYVDPESGAYAQISIPKYLLLGLNVSF